MSIFHEVLIYNCGFKISSSVTTVSLIVKKRKTGFEWVHEIGNFSRLYLRKLCSLFFIVRWTYKCAQYWKACEKTRYSISSLQTIMSWAHWTCAISGMSHSAYRYLFIKADCNEYFIIFLVLNIIIFTKKRSRLSPFLRKYCLTEWLLTFFLRWVKRN